MPDVSTNTNVTYKNEAGCVLFFVLFYRGHMNAFACIISLLNDARY